MKLKIKLISLVFCFSLAEITYSQVAPTIIVENKTLTSGIHNYCSHNCIISPNIPSNTVAISGTAQVNYTAGNCIHLKPGFSVSALSGSGKFKAQLENPNFQVVVLSPITTPTTQVGKYEKLELGLDLPTSIDNLVSDYFNSGANSTNVNPFNPEDIDIVANFSSPSGSLNRIIYGFYMEDFERVQDVEHNYSWNPIINEYNFRIRFAPNDLGKWKCDIKVISHTNKFPPIDVDCIEFECIPSANKGYLQVGHHKRHLKFSETSESFFPIGQNIPWIESGQNYWASNVFHPEPFIDYYNKIVNIADNNGNFFRTILANWSHGIEWEKSNDYSKYIGTFQGAAYPVEQNRQHNAFEFDKIINLCESRNLFMDLCIEMHTGWANPADNNDPLYEWNYNTYNTSLNINSPLDFLNDPNGRIIYKRKLRYIMSRWGYSSSIGIVELLSEPDGWWNYSNSNSAITDLYNWHAFMIDYLKNELGYTNHLYSTGMATRSGSTYALNSIDISSTHMYARAKKLNHERYNHMNENNILNSNNGLLVDYDKPSIFGEMGIMGGNVDPNLLEGCNDIAFHNALWSTSFMGCLGPGLNWWQTGNNSYRSQNFPALNAFFNNINFETDAFTYPQKWRETTIPFDDYNLEVFAVRNFNKEKIMGWAHSASNYWGNVSDNCTINGNMPNLPPDDDNTSNPIPSIDQFKLDNLKLLTKYNIDWYYTRNIGPLGAPFHSLNKWSNIFGTLKTTLPSINEYDYAFKAYKTEIHSQFDSPPEIDTLLCFEDSIQVDGNSNNDSSIISYSWNFGNGTISSLPNPIVQYSSPGTYNVILIRTDTSGISDTLTQTIYVPDCQTLFKNQNLQLMDNNFVIVYPNPNNGMFDVTFGNNIEGDKHIQLINNNGVVIFSTHSNESILGINLLSESNGLYFLKIVFDNGQTTIKKIIKQ